MTEHVLDAWNDYQRKLNGGGYVQCSPGGYEHKGTGYLIKPFDYGPQPDGTVRHNWQYWAECDHVPPPF